MDESYELSWEDATSVVQQEEVISSMDNVNVNKIISAATQEYATEEDVEETVVEEVQCVEEQDAQGLSDETVSTVEETPLSGAEENNVMYITDDSDVMEAVPENFTEQDLMAVTQEEVITEYPQEIIIGSEEAVGHASQTTEEVEIPLATDQDEYTAARPYPCDFCSRRFRKKTNLMNHMVAHQTDRPHACNLCGVRYVRKADLMNHLKTHAYIPESEVMEDGDLLFPPATNEFGGKRKPRTYIKRKKKKNNYEFLDSTRETVASGSQYYPDNVKLIDETEDDTEDYFGTSNEEDVKEIKYPATDPKKPFVCQHCGVSFAREKALASHSRIHGGDSPFECQKCGEMFWDANKMKIHLKEQHGDIADFDLDEDDDYSDSGGPTPKYGTFYCTTCGLSFHRQDNLRRHQRIHTNEEYLNEQEVGHICNVCGESFQEALDLLAHAEVHARGSEFRCMVCGEVCVDENLLAAHVQALHAKNLGEHSCLLCGRTCKDSKTLMKHSWEHSKEKTFACSQCSKTFHNKARLKRHMLSHRNKVVACEECGEEFPDGRSLMNHRHSHSSVSGRQFPCRECGKTFGSRSSQQIHIRIHTGERPYGCRFCWKAFADGGTLRKHERIHTGEKPYACAVCPRAFNQRVVLREHIRSHHSGPDPKYTHSMTPYCCAVCSDMFATSQDLILHLIHHCDLNTAMKREPQVGPRKYKRRRKLKPHELELISNRQGHPEDGTIVYEEQDNEDNEQFETEGFHYEETEELPIDEEVEAQHEMQQRRPRRNSRRISTGSGKGDISDPYEQMLEGLTASAAAQQTQLIQQQDTAIPSEVSVPLPTPPTRGRGRPPKYKGVHGASPPSRPKMIHTQKTKIPTELTDEGKLKHKTKTMVTRTQPAEIKSSTGERIRPRTKNVSYHIVSEKLPTATFADSEPQEAVENLLKQTEMEQHALEEQVEENQQEGSNSDMARFCEPQLDEVATEQTIEADAPVPMNIVKVTRRMSTRSTTKATNSMQIIGGQKVRIVKSGMLITKPKRNSESVSESEGTLISNPNPENGQDFENPEPMQVFIKEESLNIEDTKVLVKSEHIENQSVKQEMMDPSALRELAEISMRHGNELFRCEMCDAVFTDNKKLLDHVAIHI